jgi:hypothetical protein
MARKPIRMLPHGHNAINRARALFTAHFPGETAASGRVRMLAAQPRGAQVRCAAADWRGILNHRHLA